MREKMRGKEERIVVSLSNDAVSEFYLLPFISVYNSHCQILQRTPFFETNR